MKSVERTSDLHRTAVLCAGPCRHRSENRKERLTTDAALVVVIAMTIALYAAMFIGIYRWIHYDPVFPLDNQSGTTELNLMPAQ